MYINAVNTYWVQANQDAGDVIIQVQAEKLAGPEDSHYGVMCRHDKQNLEAYMFLVTSAGEVGIAKYSTSCLTFLGPGELQFSEAVHLDGQPNHIEALCLGSTLTLIVNNQEVLTVEDPSLEKGDAGLVAGSLSETGADILFDDFILLIP